MQTLLEVLGLSGDLVDSASRLRFVDDEVDRCLAEGNALGAGEWLIERARVVVGADQLDALSRAIG